MTQLDSAVAIPVRLIQAAGDSYAQLDEANSEVVERVVLDTRPTVIRGCPGSGRTSVALNVAKRLQEQSDGDVLVVVPDRLRADLLQVAGEHALPGVVRPVRTPVSLAFDFTSRWFVERTNPRPAPQLRTGAREDSDLSRAIEEDLVKWPSELRPETLEMPEFRMEVRNLMARARESGWSGQKLEEIGQEIGRGMWISTGQLMQEWAKEAELADSPDEPPLYDSAGLQELAAEIISSWDIKKTDEGVLSELDAPAAVVVDDLQDCTGATLTLLEALHGAGTRIIATADPDVAVATYRGGEPHLDGRLIKSLDARIENLGPTHRGNQALRHVVQKVTEQVTVQDSAERRAMGSYDPSTDASGLSVKVVGSHAQEANAIARQIRRYELGYGTGATGPIPLSNQAVVVRSSGDVNRIRFGLLRNGVQTTIRRRALTYASDPVTSTLLLLLDGNSAEIGSEHQLFDRLLRSPLINARMTDVRRISDFYKAHVDSQKIPLLTMVENLVDQEPGTEQVAKKAAAHGLKQTYSDLVKAFRLMKQGRKSRGESPQAALWKLWELADVTDTWANRALQPGVESEVFDERLDAVVSLFRTADVWEQRHPGGTVEQFARELLEERLPTDTLAETGQRPDGVHVLTVAQAIGQDWDVVYIAGMQDGHWPNLTLRDRLSRAGEVTELANGNIEPATLKQDGANTRIMRKAALVEEYRLLAAAISRARHALHISAVQNDDDAPSFILNNLAKWTQTPLVDGIHLPITKVEPGIDTRSLVARLRQDLGKTKDENLQKWYSTLLAVLATEGVHIANPSSWNGVGGLTPELAEAKEVVTLSPSQIELLVQCPARWFLTRHGGDKPWSDKAAIGNLVHQIAEEMPDADFDKMLNRLDELWDEELFPRETTLGQKLYDSIVEKLEKLANYLVDWRGKTVQIEHPVFQEVVLDGERLNIAGRLDRVEHTSDGRVYITDIKTGDVPSQKDTVSHLQLAAYQFALNAQDVSIVEARLLALSKANPKNWKQPNLFGEGTCTVGKTKFDIPEKRKELEGLIATAARTAKGNVFPPITGTYCSHCPVREMCPVQDEGLRTLE